MRLLGKSAIITGGANGIGRATAFLFAAEGARVIVADRDVPAGQSCAARIQGGGGQALFLEADISQDDSVDALVDRAVDRFGGLDILVNSAGVSIAGSVVDTEPDRWRRVLDVNLAGVYRTCRRAIPRMIERGGGAIVNVASLQGLYGWRGWAAYAASKAGIVGLTRQIAVEYADHHVRANAVSPGGIATDLEANTARLEPQYQPAAGAAVRAAELDSIDPTPGSRAASPRPHDLRGVGVPLDVAYAILYLASDEAAHVSGQNLAVDGIASARVD
ncbi:MAG: SDR family NAD(P)-dependent oxidoreductase [Gemmatimonadota bacterium]